MLSCNANKARQGTGLENSLLESLSLTGLDEYSLYAKLSSKKVLLDAYNNVKLIIIRSCLYSLQVNYNIKEPTNLRSSYEKKNEIGIKLLSSGNKYLSFRSELNRRAGLLTQP